jgi:hypothetical protein
MPLHLRLKIGDIDVPLPPKYAPKYGWAGSYFTGIGPSLGRDVVVRVFNLSFHCWCCV